SSSLRRPSSPPVLFFFPTPPPPTPTLFPYTTLFRSLPRPTRGLRRRGAGRGAGPATRPLRDAAAGLAPPGHAPLRQRVLLGRPLPIAHADRHGVPPESALPPRDRHGRDARLHLHGDGHRSD